LKVGSAARPFVKKGDWIDFRTGPFFVRLETRLPELLDPFYRFYGRAVDASAVEPFDFYVAVKPPVGLRRWFRPQVLFFLDSETPFEPFPRSHAFPLLEWGLNYAIATRAHQYCLLHSAVLERNGRALILPALPGSGKSTLCAALMHRGWRLLSDEFGMVRPETGELVPMPRVIPLKNRSIEVIRDFAPEAVLGPVFPGTRKGDVAHLAPTADSLARQHEPARPAWIVFPRFVSGAGCTLEPVADSLAFIRLSNNSFNYQLLGETAYRTLTRLVAGCERYHLEYGDLESAVVRMEALAAP